MSFIIKKKRFKFQVNLEVEELSSVPFVSGVLFSKIRLVDGGSFKDYTPRVELVDHKVRWKAKYLFVCKLSANASTGVLDSSICRISVRKELKGGKAYQRYGFADVDLAQFAGAGRIERRYLLGGYDSSQRRQDNAILKINIDMSLLKGDLLFKSPASHPQGLQGEPVADHNLHDENKSQDPSGDSVASGSSGFGSLPRKRRDSVGSGESDSTPSSIQHSESSPEFELGHRREDSSTSHRSKASDYSSLAAHSRTSSYDKRDPTLTSGDLHLQYGSLSKLESNKGIMKQKILEPSSSMERRMDSTRVDADELVDELISATDLGSPDDSAETSGLQLFVATDGTTILGSHQVKNQPRNKSFQKVIIDHTDKS